MSNNSDSENESDYSESESNSETGDSINSDDDEYFIRFNSTTYYDHVDYVMIGSSCYEYPDENNSSNQNSDNSDSNECNECLHDVLVYYINGYVDQQMITKNEVKDICRLQGINLSSHDIFEHLLE